SQPASSPPQGGSSPKVELMQSCGKLPLSFVENQGQVNQRALYYLKGRERTIYFTKEKIIP
ncbi:MAG TPA: hypothetical protein PLG17_04675, partial [Thermodesulfobacteriota bacterium]|nr:hypothetical protein [Thermodesulfobacteriota bacterium]